jgi:periplasmic copper chaperone A
VTPIVTAPLLERWRRAGPGASGAMPTDGPHLSAQSHHQPISLASRFTKGLGTTRFDRTAGPVRRALFVLCAVCAVLAGGAPGVGAAGLALSNPWFRLVLPSLPAAGYFTLLNPTGSARTLVGAASPGCGMLMLHRSLSEHGEERMVMVERVAVPAYGKVSFAPDGYHLMCMSPTAQMRPGQSVPVTLRFADGTSLTATFPVRNATGK